MRHCINSPIKTDKCLKYLVGSALITGSVRQRGQLVGDLLYCCMTKATIAQDDHYPPLPLIERGNSRGVCEQKAAEGDHYPALPPIERGDSRGVCEQETGEGGHYPPVPAVESGNPRRVPEKETGEGDYYPRLAPLGRGNPRSVPQGKAGEGEHVRHSLKWVFRGVAY